MPLTNADNLSRYAVQSPLPGIGKEGQSRLRTAHVLVAGLGALGTFSSVYLCTAGIGHLTLVDSGTVTRESLNQQVLYQKKDVGEKKVLAATKRLSRMNSDVEINPIQSEMNQDNVLDLLERAHIILDGTDNFKTRFLLNQACHNRGLPFVYGGVLGFKGAVMTIIPGQTPCLSCFLPEKEKLHSHVPTVGPFVGLTASIQVMEVIKLILHRGEPLSGTLLVIDGHSIRFQRYIIRKNLNCKVCTSFAAS